MTTSVSIKNHGPNTIRVRHRNIAKSARKNDSDNHEVEVLPGQSTEFQAVYEGRKIIIEEVEK